MYDLNFIFIVFNKYNTSKLNLIIRTMPDNEIKFVRKCYLVILKIFK